MALGDRFTDESRLTRLLMQQPNHNNGTMYGGLAHVLNQGLLGYSAGRDNRNQEAATRALLEGMGAKPYVNPDTDEQMGTAGGYEGAIYALQNQQNNPYAGRLASQLMMGQAQAGMEDQRWENRFERQNAAEMERFQAQQAAQDQRFQQQLAAQREIAQMRAAQGAEAPSSIREWQAFQQMTPEQQQQYLTMKRANPYLNLGDVFAQPDPLNPGQVRGQIGVGISPERTIQDGRVITMPGVPGDPRGDPPQLGQSAPMPPQGQMPQPGQMPQGTPQFQPPALPQQGFSVQDLPQSAEDAEKERLRQQNRARAGGTVIQDVNRALQMVEENPGRTTGFGAQMLRGIPMTDAKTVQGHIDSALSNVGLDTLQAMREASPTGGALGQVPIQQQQRLEQVLGSLDPTQRPEIVSDNLKRVANIYMDIVHGTPEQIAEQVRLGKIDPMRAQEIMQRHPLSFDEFGYPVGRSPVPSQQFMPQQNTPPQNGGWSIQRID